MLGGGVMVQRFGDLIRGQRSTPKRIEKSFVTPTLSATPGDHTDGAILIPLMRVTAKLVFKYPVRNKPC